MEQKLGRSLVADEHIHHINGDKDDDRPENLELTDRSGHAKEHYARGDLGIGFGRRILDCEKISGLMKSGFGYKRIAKALAYKVDSVKSACRKLRVAAVL